MRLRQVAAVAADLEAAVSELRAALGLEVSLRDPGVAAFGLDNAVMPVGDGFLEVVSPHRPGTAAGRYLERHGGDGGYMVLLQIDDLERRMARLRRLGVRTVWEGARDGIRGVHLHPADIGGAIVSLDEPHPPESWDWAGPDWRRHARTDVVAGIAAVELRAGDPRALAARWARILELDAEVTADDGALLRLDGGSVRFAAGAEAGGERVSGVDLVAADRRRAGEELRLVGMRVRLV